MLLILTEAIYLPPSVLRGTNTLFGYDYILLHARRLSFARDALFSGGHLLPGWYPREMLGSPFSANIQNFPFIPSHLPLLLFDPDVAYSAGVAIAAALAALFTYLFCRRIGLSPIGAVAAGWTFSCAGYFAARVMLGELTLIEAYPSLPLLLWLADRAMDPQRAGVHRRDMLRSPSASPASCWRDIRSFPPIPWQPRFFTSSGAAADCLRVRLCSAIALGIGATMAVWWPMLLLVQRSTRVLPLARSAGDIMLTYHRLLALAVPGIDGWGNGVRVPPGHLFAGFSSLFWDTFAYTGILPLAAAAILVLGCLLQRRFPASRWMFLGVVGLAALVFALPLLEPLRRLVPGTIMRSPARALYLYTFSLSAAFGAGVDAVLRWNPIGRPVFGRAAVFVCLAFHAWDLGGVSRLFILPTPWHPTDIPEFEEILAREAGESRVAVSVVVAPRLGYKYDSPGGYDSIFLVETFRALTALAGLPADYSEEHMDAGSWPPHALSATGVKFVVTWQPRTDLELVKTAAGTLDVPGRQRCASRGFLRRSNR